MFLGTPLHPPALMFFLTHFSCCSLSPGEGRSLMQTPHLNMSPHDHLFSSPHCIKQLLWLILGTTQICGYKHQYLEWSLTIWPFSKTTVVGSPLSPMISQLEAFDQVYSTRHEISPVEQALHPIRQQLVTPHSSCRYCATGYTLPSRFIL